jgi:hypothetical protein
MKAWKRVPLCVTMLCFLSGCTKEPAYSSVTKEQYEAAFTPANNFTQVIESTITSDNAATLTMKETYCVTDRVASWEETLSGRKNGTNKAYWWFDDKGALNHYEKDDIDGASSYSKFLKYPLATETTVSSVTDFGYMAQWDNYTHKLDCSIFNFSYAGILNNHQDGLAYDKVKYDEKEKDYAYTDSTTDKSYKLYFAGGLLSKLIFTSAMGSDIAYHLSSTLHISAYGTTEVPVVSEEAKAAEINKSAYAMGGLF